jgi:hypothetical protein
MIAKQKVRDNFCLSEYIAREVRVEAYRETTRLSGQYRIRGG